MRDFLFSTYIYSRKKRKKEREREREREMREHAGGVARVQIMQRMTRHCLPTTKLVCIFSSHFSLRFGLSSIRFILFSYRMNFYLFFPYNIPDWTLPTGVRASSRRYPEEIQCAPARCILTAGHLGSYI